MSVEVNQHAALSAAWLTAALRGTVGVEQTIDVLAATGPPARLEITDPPELLTLPFAIARWRRIGVQGWRYAPVAPGDAAGLPGPATFVAAAIDRGVALVSDIGPTVGLIPEIADQKLHWTEHQTSGQSRPALDTPAEAEQALLEALNRAVQVLDAHDLASWGDDQVSLRDQWDDPEPMPPGTDVRCERLAGRSLRVLQMIEHAAQDDGGSRTVADVQMRGAVLTELNRAALRGHAAAWNAGLRGARENH